MAVLAQLWKWSRLTRCIVVCAYARDRKMKVARKSENGVESAVC